MTLFLCKMFFSNNLVCVNFLCFSRSGQIDMGLLENGKIGHLDNWTLGKWALEPWNFGMIGRGDNGCFSKCIEYLGCS